MTSQAYRSFKGTAREFINAGVTINGKDINQPGLSLMAQYGVAKIIGEVTRPEGKRGHPEKIYFIQGKSGLKVDYNLTVVTSARSAQHENLLCKVSDRVRL